MGTIAATANTEENLKIGDSVLFYYMLDAKQSRGIVKGFTDDNKVIIKVRSTTFVRKREEVVLNTNNNE